MFSAFRLASTPGRSPCDPLSVPNTAATRVYPLRCAHSAIAVPLAESGGNNRQKYGSVFVLYTDSPATAVIGIFAEFSTGTSAGADAVSGPATRTRLLVVAIACCMAGNASAGSALVSTAL